MLIFLIVTIMFLFSGAFALRIFFEMIEQDGALDIVFGWQKMLGKLYASQNKYSQFLEKALGGCKRCTAFWFMPVWFSFYYIISKFAFGIWLTDKIGDNTFLIAFANFIWYSMFHSVGATIGFSALQFKSKK